MGRAPDHRGFAIRQVHGLEVFEAHDKARAGALSEYYRFASGNDLFLTYVIINPQADRSKRASRRRLVARVVDQDPAA